MAKAKYTKNSRGEFETRIWDGTYNKDGSKHRKKLTSKKSSADLEKKVAAFKESVANGGVTDYTSMSFTDYAWHWFETSKMSKEKNTQLMYRNVVKNHLSFLSDVRVSDIRHTHFQQAINLQIDHPRTCQYISLTFKQIIRSAVRDKLLPHSAIEDICADISLPKYHKPQKRGLTPEEREALFKASLDPRKRAFVSILYYCGLRRGEALALTRFDFDWKKNTVNINKVIIFVNGLPELKDYPKTDNSIRSVPIPEAAVKYIKPYVQSNQDKYLFHGRNRDMMTDSAYKRMWESIVSSMNIALGYNPNAKINRSPKPIQGLTAHIFRHDYCTQLCYQVPRISTKMIARMLGDTEQMVLNVYSHIDEEKEDVINAINLARAE